MPLVLDSGTRRARKPHRCYECGTTIPGGATVAYQTCKYDDVYTLYMHPDCQEAGRHYAELAGYYENCEDGTPPLFEMIGAIGPRGQSDLDDLRGRWPHVVCRIELDMQRAATS